MVFIMMLQAKNEKGVRLVALSPIMVYFVAWFFTNVSHDHCRRPNVAW